MKIGYRIAVLIIFLYVSFSPTVIQEAVPQVKEEEAKIKIENADTIWEAVLAPSENLTSAAKEVLPRIFTEYTDSGFLRDLIEPQELMKETKDVPLRIITEYTDSSFVKNFKKPEELEKATETVVPRITVEYVDSSFVQNLKKPEKLVDVAKTVSPRIVIENVTSVLSIDLVPFPSGLLAKQMEIKAIPDKLIADGSQTAQITVTLKDEYGNPVTDETVTITATSGEVSKVKNNRDGTYSATYTSGKQAGEVTLKATATNAGISKSIKITLFTGAVSELAFKLSLDSGPNMVSLPLDPGVDLTARDFAEKLGATTVISFDTTEDKFIPFVPEVFSGDGFPIEGGQGYIVNVLKKKDVVFTGTGWSNVPSEAPAAPPLEKTTWAFVITGTVFDEYGEPLRNAFRSAESLKSGPVYSVAEVLRNHKTTTCPVGQLEEAKFAISLVDMNRKAVVFADELLKVLITDAVGNVISGPIKHRISAEDIKKGYAKFNMRLGDVIPEKSALLQNYPNPFNPETWIPYQLAHGDNVVIRIYNINGQLVRILNLSYREAGLYLSKGRAAYWDGRSETGEKVASGVYFYTIDAGSFRATRRMVIIR